MQKPSLKVRAIFDSWLDSLRTVTTITSDDRLQLLWGNVQREFFPERTDLLEYTVGWSKRRQKRTLASCNIKQLRIVVAKELNHPNYNCWLEPLLYHEMCHAVIGMGVERSHGKRRWHGREFKQLERRHPQMAALDLWIKSGGWRHAVRSDRSRAVHARRRESTL